MIVIPTLTIDGYDSNGATQMVKLFEYYQVADYSQSNTFYKEIVSLKKTLSLYNNTDELIDMIKDDIVKLYSTIFETVVPNVLIKDTENEYKLIEISIQATKGKKTYTLTKELKADNNILLYTNSTLNNIYKIE